MHPERHSQSGGGRPICPRWDIIFVRNGEINVKTVECEELINRPAFVCRHRRCGGRLLLDGSGLMKGR